MDKNVSQDRLGFPQQDQARGTSYAGAVATGFTQDAVEQYQNATENTNNALNWRDVVVDKSYAMFISDSLARFWIPSLESSNVQACWRSLASNCYNGTIQTNPSWPLKPKSGTNSLRLLVVSKNFLQKNYNLDYIRRKNKKYIILKHKGRFLASIAIDGIQGHVEYTPLKGESITGYFVPEVMFLAGTEDVFEKMFDPKAVAPGFDLTDATKVVEVVKTDEIGKVSDGGSSATESKVMTDSFVAKNPVGDAVSTTYVGATKVAAPSSARQAIGPLDIDADLIVSEDSSKFTGWEEQLDSVNLGSTDRYDVEDDDMVISSYRGPYYPDYTTFASLSSMFTHWPNTMDAIDLGKGSYGWRMTPHYRFGPGDVPRWLVDMFLVEKRSIKLYSEDADIDLPCIFTGDKYQVGISAGFKTDTDSQIDLVNQSRKYSSLWGGREYNAFYNMMMGYAGTYPSGENHIAYLVSMMRYYLSATVKEATNGHLSGRSKVGSQQCRQIIELKDLADLSSRNQYQIVNCTWKNVDYLHFLMVCAQSGKTAYRCSPFAGSKATTFYDKLDIQFDKEMLIIYKGDMDVQYHEPKWPGNSRLILEYVRMYCNGMILGQQLDDAVSILKCLAGIENISLIPGLGLPFVRHVSDYLQPILTPLRSGGLYIDYYDNTSYVKRVASEYIVGQLIEASCATFIEGALANRNTDVVDDFRIMFVMNRFDVTTNLGNRKLLRLASTISGIDLSVLRQVGGGNIVSALVANYVDEPYTGTFERMLIARPTKDSWSHWIRRSTVYSTNSMNSGIYADTMEVVQLLTALKFNQQSRDISESWSVKPKCEYSRSFFYTSDDAKASWLDSLRGTASRLYFWKVTWDDYQGAERTRMGNENVRWAEFKKTMMKAKPLSAPAIDRSAYDRKEAEKKFLSAEQYDILLAKLEERDAKAETAKAKEIAAIAHAANLTHLQAKEETITMQQSRADIFWSKCRDMFTANQDESLIAKDRFEAQEWEPVEGAPGEQYPGDCGPTAAYNCIQIYGGQMGKDNLPAHIRRKVEEFAGLEHQRGEWWDQANWNIFGQISKCTVLLRVRQPDDTLQYTMVYWGEGPLIYIEHVHGNHWVCLKPKKIKKVMIKDDAITVETREDPELESPITKESIDSDANKKKKASFTLETITSTKEQSDDYKKGKTADYWADQTTARIVSAHKKGEVSDYILLDKLKKIKKDAKHLDLIWLRLADKIVSSVQNSGLDIKSEDVFNLERYLWDSSTCNLMDYEELTEMGDKDNRLCSPLTPRWVESMRMVDNTVNTWKYVESNTLNGNIPLPLCRLWFIVLFPGRPIPGKFMEYDEGELFVTRGCGCLACNVVKRVWHCAGKKCKEDNCSWFSDRPKSKVVLRSVMSLLPANLKKRLTKDDCKLLNRCFPFSNAKGGIKTNLDLGSLVYILYNNVLECNSMWKLIREFLILRSGQSNNMVSAMLLYLAGNTMSATGHHVLNRVGYLGTCPKHYLDHFSAFHDEVRTTMAYNSILLTPTDHSQLMYVHLLYGRLGKEVDWVEEKKKRTREREPMVAWDGEKWDSDYARKLIIQGIRKVFANVRKAKKKLLSLEELFETRHEWIAGGAATGRSKVMDGKEASGMCGEEVQTNELKVNKRSYAEKMEFSELTDALKKKPVQYAYAHTKLNELAKLRSIFGVDLVHYMLHHFICVPVELGLKMDSISLKEDTLQGWDELKERMDWCVGKEELNSFDFSDFNDQHDLGTMRDLHQVMVEWYKEIYANDPSLGDYVEVGDWISESFMNSVYVDKETGEEVHVSGGMYSGNRATTMINSILNYAYLHMVETSLSNMEGSTKFVRDAFRLGDDVVMKMKDSGSSIYFNIVAQRHGIIANSMKLLSEKGRCEYLRLMYYEDGSVLGSLCRSVGAFVNGNWESEAMIDPVARTQACWEQCSVLMRRGMNLRLVREIFANVVSFFSSVIHRSLQTKPIPPNYIQTSVDDGGMGLGQLGSGEVLNASIPYPKFGKTRNYSSSEVPRGKMKASKDIMTVYNRDRLPDWAKIEQGSLDRAYDGLTKSTLGTELPASRTNLGLSKSEVDSLVTISNTANFVVNKKSRKSKKNFGLLNEVRGKIVESTKDLGDIRRLEKFKMMLPYITIRDGHSEDALIKTVTGVNPHTVRNIDEKVDRTDGGCVPPQLFSQISLYARLCNADVSELFTQYKNTKLYDRIRY